MKESNETINWPSWWKGSRRHWLEGMPLIGSHVKLQKHMQLILSGRNESDCVNKWSMTAYDEAKRKLFLAKVYKVVRAYIKLPNHFYFPSDLCAVSLGIFPGSWYDPEDIISDISKELEISDKASLCDIIEKSTLEDLIKLYLNSENK